MNYDILAVSTLVSLYYDVLLMSKDQEVQFILHGHKRYCGNYYSVLFWALRIKVMSISVFGSESIS